MLLIQEFDSIFRLFTDETVFTICFMFVGVGFAVSILISLLVWSVFYLLNIFKKITRS